MARPLRIEFPGAIYHVMSRGNARQTVFRDDSDYQRLIKGLETVVGRLGWDLLCFVLMPNHFHLLVRTPRPNLSRGMQHLTSGYANWCSRRHRRPGHRFQGRFKSELIEDESYFWTVSRYIHLNPVRGKRPLADHRRSPWSSYPGYNRRQQRVGWEAAARLARYGPNAVRTHHVSALAVLGRQLRNAVLILLAGTAVVSFFLGDSMQAVIIGMILAASIGLGFFNEYRAERAAAELHAEMRHKALVRHDGEFVTVDVTALVPGDVIRLSLGEAVPADVRLIDVSGLECDEGILTGESTGSEKSPKPVPANTELAESTDLAFMGTIVTAGEGTGVVYATGRNAEFGRIAAGLDTRQPETDFQVGLRKFSYLLLQVAVALVVVILISNLLLRKPVIDSVLFSLAIAVGITPQLLPAVVSAGLATGSRQLAKARCSSSGWYASKISATSTS